MSELQKYPIWKEAVGKFLSAGFEYGDVIPHEWFWNAFNMNYPNDSDVMTVAEHRKIRLDFLCNFYPMRDELIAEHQRCLAAETGAGYLLVTPQKMARMASELYKKEHNKAARKTFMMLHGTRVEDLNYEQRCEHAEAMAKLARSVSLVRGIHRQRPAVADSNARGRMPPRLALPK